MSESPWKPRVTVAAIIESDDRFLMVEENVGGVFFFNQPAGHLENGERILDAVVRECLEETAWAFEPEHLVGVYRWRSGPDSDTFVRFTFCGAGVAHRPERRLDPDIHAVHWLGHAEILARRDALRSPLVLRGIEDYRHGRRFPLDLLRDFDD
jgi:8-oxo-dGTP pyrophosphatase MutT (NUDIX family)